MDYPHIDILKMRNETYLAEDTVDNVLVADIVAGKLGIDAQKHHAQDEQPTQRDQTFHYVSSLFSRTPTQRSTA